MKKHIYFLSLMLIFGCGSRYEYWDISHFQMEPNALSDKEEITILYTTRAPDYNNDLEYFIHFVVVSKKTGDTVNVLTISNTFVEKGDLGKVFNYFSPDNDASKIELMQKQGIPIENVNDIVTDKFYEIKKVVRDPAFDDIANNKYPTVIGMIGFLFQKDEFRIEDLPEDLKGDTNVTKHLKNWRP